MTLKGELLLIYLYRNNDLLGFDKLFVDEYIILRKKVFIDKR